MPAGYNARNLDGGRGGRLCNPLISMSKTKKTDAQKRPKARLPKGLRDIGPAELRENLAMLDKIRAVYERYGFEPLETPAFEYTDALGKFLPDQDRPNAGVFSFQEEDEQWVSLRYDLTAPLARYVAENYQDLALPFRRYATGSVYRNEKPGPGRFRQFTQFDADTVGTDSIAADAEMCMLAADTMEALGFERGAVCDQGQQPQSARRRDGSRRHRRRRERCQAADGAARDRQAGSARRGGGAPIARQWT